LSGLVAGTRISKKRRARRRKNGVSGESCDVCCDAEQAGSFVTTIQLCDKIIFLRTGIESDSLYVYVDFSMIFFMYLYGKW